MNKIDFCVVLTVENANPNGDPNNGNIPRQDYEGYGEMSDVCIKRKIRDRLQDMGENILVKRSDRADDGFKSIKTRVDDYDLLKDEMDKKKPDVDACQSIACANWIDVRSFGQVFGFKGNKPTATFSVRGPVSVRMARSVDVVDIEELSLTKSTNTHGDDEIKDSATMGKKYIATKGAYVTYGSIFPQLADKTGFTDEDAEKIKFALETLLENDATSARPSGSMAVASVYWWRHSSAIGQYPSIKVHRSLEFTPISTLE